MSVIDRWLRLWDVGVWSSRLPACCLSLCFVCTHQHACTHARKILFVHRHTRMHVCTLRCSHTRALARSHMRASTHARSLARPRTHAQDHTHAHFACARAHARTTHRTKLRTAEAGVEEGLGTAEGGLSGPCPCGNILVSDNTEILH